MVLAAGKFVEFCDPHPAAVGKDRLLRHHAMAKGIGHNARSRPNGIAGERARGLPGENIPFVLDVDRDVGERGFGDTEVLGQDVARRVRKQIRDQEGLVLREAAIVEHKEELAAILEALDRMRDNRREIPKIARADIVDERASLLVDGANSGVPREHVRPFRLLMPMHLANAARF